MKNDIIIAVVFTSKFGNHGMSTDGVGMGLSRGKFIAKFVLT